MVTNRLLFALGALCLIAFAVAWHPAAFLDAAAGCFWLLRVRETNMAKGARQ